MHKINPFVFATILFVFINDAFPSDPEDAGSCVQSKCEQFLKDWKVEQKELPINSVKKCDWRDLLNKAPLGGEGWTSLSLRQPVAIIPNKHLHSIGLTNLTNLHTKTNECLSSSLDFRYMYSSLVLDKPLEIHPIAREELTRIGKEYNFNVKFIENTKRYLQQMSELDLWMSILNASLDDIKCIQKSNAHKALLNMLFVTVQYNYSMIGENHVLQYENILPDHCCPR